MISQRSAFMSNYLPTGADMRNIMANELIMRRISPIPFERACTDELLSDPSEPAVEKSNAKDKPSNKPSDDPPVNNSTVNKVVQNPPN